MRYAPTLLQIMLSAHVYEQLAEKTVQGFHEIIRLFRCLTSNLIHFGTVRIWKWERTLIFNIIEMSMEYSRINISSKQNIALFSKVPRNYSFCKWYLERVIDAIKMEWKLKSLR